MYRKTCYRGAMLAIRREDVDVWERRAPLCPADVATLVREGVTVLVQPCCRRVYTDQEYRRCGARVQEEVDEASVVLGVKQVPPSHLLPLTTFAFFSHTIKAQRENMPMLDAVLHKKVCLLDYELMEDARGRSMGGVFGQFAGMAGMVTLLHGLGLRLLAMGFNNPFLLSGMHYLQRVAPCQVYGDVQEARTRIRTLQLDTFLESFGPIVFVFTGTGHVSQGAQSIFRELPVQIVSVEDLPHIHTAAVHENVYGCVVSRKDHFTRREGGVFDEQEATLHPARYTSCFNTKIAPYATCIINGIFWSPDSPRLLTRRDAANLTYLREDKIPNRPGLLALCDISADPGGSIEFMRSCTTLDNPFYLYRARDDSESNSLAGEGILICSVDKLPSLIPREATDQFSASLLPLVRDMLQIDASQTMEEDNSNPSLKHAIIARNGKLTAKYEYIDELRHTLGREEAV